MSDISGDTRWMSLGDAAALVGKSTRTVRRWVSDGKLESRRDGRRLLVNMSQFVISDDLSDDPAILRTQVAILRAEVDKLSALNERLKEENEKVWQQVNFLDTQVERLTRLREPAIEAPRLSLRERLDRLLGRREAE